jgi:hypothetical protein
MQSEDISDGASISTASATGSVSEHLFNLLKEWTYCDLILDRELSNPLNVELEQLINDDLALPVNPKAAARPFDRCLMAARLSLDRLDVLERSIDIGLGQGTNSTREIRAIGGWLFSRDVSLEQVVRRLEQAIVVRIPNAPDAMLRIWDPRVTGHVERILTAEQLADLLGPIEGWAWIDRDGQLRILQKPALQGQVRAHVLPVRLSAEQDAAIDRIEYINTLLKTLAKLGHKVAASRDAELDELVRTAQAKGHRALPDMIAYCLHALLIAASFDAIPEVQQAIAKAHAQGLGLCVALEHFDDAYWDAQKLNSGAQMP